MAAAVWDTGDVSARGPARLVAPLAVLSQERTHATRLYHAHERLRALVHAACIEPEPRWQTEQERLQLLDEQLDSFFAAELAPAIQHRETTTVDVIQQCVRSELQAMQDKLQTTTQQNQALLERIAALEQETSLAKSKLDRRVAENNELRKDFYKQLLMLREMVNKNRNDPRTLKTLDDEIVNITQDATSKEAWDAAGGGGYARSKVQTSAKGDTTGMPAGSMRREKEKWEERARETMTKCHHLQQQILVLKQQNETLRGADSEMWFLSSQHGLIERQRIMDAIYRSKCTWKHVGEAIVELLNNDLLWQAVEDSIRQEKPRVSRGLAALMLQLDQLEEDQQDSGGQSAGATKMRIFGRRRSSLGESGRLIPCESCNGSGYLDAEDDNSGESDSYLRKTLAQVLELKTSLNQANLRLVQVENELQGTHAQAAVAKEKLRVIEQTRLHSVEYGTQADLDDEEPVSLDEIMNAFNDPGNSRSRLRRKGHRQHEHLIVELKNSLTEKEAGLIEARTILAETQARLLSLQRKSQRDQEEHQQETTALKTSLTLAMNNRSSAIDEKQAAVKLMLKRIDKQMQLQKQHMTKGSFSSAKSSGEGSDEEGEDNALDGFPDPTALGENEGKDEIQRSEMIARRYTEAIVRVQKEYEDQQALLQQAEQEDNDEATNRKRTNSITLGNIVVTMTSHPRDLFKALSTAKTEILHMRRSTQRASTLQTDRLLTLTTHLGHISEELCMVRKRTTAEIEYWKLECEKLQHSNKSMTTSLHRAQSQLQTRSERQSTTVGTKSCTLCDKHQVRLMEISNKLISDSLDPSPQDILSGSSVGAINENESNTIDLQASTGGFLSESERTGLSVAMLELENVYAMLNESKQENARALLMQALLSMNTSVDVNSSGKRNLISSSFRPDILEKNEASSSSKFEVAMQNRRLKSRLSSRLSQSAIHIEGNRTNELSINQEYAERNIARRVSNLSPTSDSRSPSFRLSVSQVIDDDDLYNNNVDELDVRGKQYFIKKTDLSPTHHKKKIVKTILSEEEVLQRRRARRRTQEYGNSVVESHDKSQLQPEFSQEQDLSKDAENAAEDVVTTYLDSDGREIHYIEEEIDDDDNAGLDFQVGERNEVEQPEQFDNQSTTEPIPPIDKCTAMHTLQPDIVSDANLSDMDQNRIDKSASFAVLNDFMNIERDPQDLSDLQGLVKQSASMKESMALTNWTILISHIRTLRDRNRLEQINRESKRVMPSVDGPESLFLVVRSTMQNLVQYREMFLDASIQARNQLRNDMRKLHAHLIHSVSTILSALTRKSTAKKVLPYYPRVVVSSSSTPKSPSNRIVYPAVQVNLNAIPPTQQIPTCHFPLLRSAIARPSSATTPISHSESQMPHITSPCASASQMPLAYEEGNRFPQRSMKFMGSIDGPELSLTHSTSGILSKDTSFPPSDSPTRSLMPRMTSSASPKRTALSTVVEQIYRTSKPITANSIDSSAIRQPTRPRSSPGDMAPRSSPRNPEALSRALAAFCRQESPDTTSKSDSVVRSPETTSTLAVRIPTQRQVMRR